MKLNECPSEHSSYGLHCSCITAQSSRQCCYCGQEQATFVLDVIIDRLPSGNFNMLNERGYLICRVADGSKLAEFIEKQFENKTGSFTLTMQLKKP